MRGGFVGLNRLVASPLGSYLISVRVINYVDVCLTTYNATFSFADFVDFPAPEIGELGDAVSEISYHWKEVGRGLGLTEGQLGGIQQNTAGQVQQAQKCLTEVFIYWKVSRTSPYTWEKLVSVLLQRRLATDSRQLVTDLHNTLSDRYPSIR